jgi:hypothetical protein
MGKIIIDARRSSHEQEKPVVPPPVKEITANQQKPVLLAIPESPVKRDNKDKKNKINGGIKKHGRRLAAPRRATREDSERTYLAAGEGGRLGGSALPNVVLKHVQLKIDAHNIRLRPRAQKTIWKVDCIV